MNRNTFLERLNKKKTWEQSHYAFKTFQSHFERLKKAPTDKQDALIDDCVFFLSFTERNLLQGVDAIYRETSHGLRDKLLQTVAEKIEDAKEPLVRVWAFRNPPLGTFLWQYAKKVLDTHAESQYVSQVGEKAQQLLSLNDEKALLGLKEFCFHNSGLIPQVVNTSYFDEFFERVDTLGSIDFRRSIVSVLNYGHEEQALKDKLHKIFTKRPQSIPKEDFISVWVALESHDRKEANHLLTLYNDHDDLNLAPYTVRVFRGAKTLEVFDRHKEPLSLQDLTQVFVARHHYDKLTEDFTKKLIEQHKNCVWLGASCKEALFTMVQEWKKQPQARVFDLMVRQLNASERSQILDQCRSENRPQLMKKIMKEMTLEELSAYKQRSYLWNTKQQQAFTMMFNKLQNKDLSQELSDILKQKDTQKRKM